VLENILPMGGERFTTITKDRIGSPGETEMEKTTILMCVGAMYGLAGCVISPPDVSCRGQSAKIHASPGMLRINNECISARAGQTIRLELVGGKAPGTVHTRPDRQKNANAKWLDQSNTDEGEIRFVVPAVKPVDTRDGADSCEENVCTFKYEIVVDGVGMLDPRIRVNF
jgi:hypothetical protein